MLFFFISVAHFNAFIDDDEGSEKEDDDVADLDFIPPTHILDTPVAPLPVRAARPGRVVDPEADSGANDSEDIY